MAPDEDIGVGVRGTPKFGGIASAKFVADVVARGSLVVLAGLIVRFEGTDGLGAYAQVQAVATLLGPLATVGLAHAAVPFFASRRWDVHARRDAYRILSLGVSGAALAGLVVALFAHSINEVFLGWPRGAALFRAAGALVVAFGLELLVLELLKARERFRRYVVVQLAYAFGVLAAAAAVLSLGLGMPAFVAAAAGVRLLTALFGITALGRPEQPPSGPPPVLSLAAAVRFGLPVSLSGLGAWMVAVSDRLVIGHFHGAEVLGRYAAVYTASGLLAAVGAAVFLPAYPRLVKALADGGEAGLAEELRRLHAPLATVVIAVVGFLLLVTRPALDLVAGHPLQLHGATIALVLLAVAGDQWNGLVHFALLAARRSRAVQRAWLLGAAVGLFADLVLVPPFAAVGAAAATLMAYATVNVLLVIAARSHIAFVSVYAWSRSAVSVGVALVAAGAALLVAAALQPGLARLAASTGIYWSCWLLFLRTQREGKDAREPERATVI